jgi:hypothetical protein
MNSSTIDKFLSEKIRREVLRRAYRATAVGLTHINLAIMAVDRGTWFIQYQFEIPLECVDLFVNCVTDALDSLSGTYTDGSILGITRHDDYLIFRTPEDPVSLLAAAAPMSIASAEPMIDELDQLRDAMEKVLGAQVEFRAA